MTVRYLPTAEEDLRHWATHDRAKLAKIRRLVASIQIDPTQGIGKPEMLRGNLAGLWSRRIDQEHRLIYRIVGADVQIIAARGHYTH